MDVFNTGNIREHMNTHFFITYNQSFPPPSPPPLSPSFLFPTPNDLLTHLVLFNDFTDIIQIFFGEHKPDIATDVRQDPFQ